MFVSLFQVSIECALSNCANQQLSTFRAQRALKYSFTWGLLYEKTFSDVIFVSKTYFPEKILKLQYEFELEYTYKFKFEFNFNQAKIMILARKCG